MQQRTIGSGPTSTDVSVLCLGTMRFGTHTPRETAFEVLDRFVDAGGTFLDTANNYNAWDAGGHGHESEDVIGAWLASRGLRDRVRIATKCGAAKKDPALPLSGTPPTNYQGLAAETIHREAATSLRHLGVDRLDVRYGHVDDRDTALEETVGAFGKLVADGVVGVPGISNVTTWRVVEARETAARLGVEPYGLVQQQGSYVYPSPTPFRSNWVSGDLLDYAASTGVDGRSPLAVTVYSPLHQGAYTRADKSLFGGADHPSSRRRVEVLREVAREAGATANQVALAWLLGGPTPVIPIVGAHTVAQLDESLGALDLVLDDELRARLDEA